MARNIATEGKRNGARRSCRWSTEASVTDDVSVSVGLSPAYSQKRRRVDRSCNIGNHDYTVLLRFLQVKKALLSIRLWHVPDELLFVR